MTGFLRYAGVYNHDIDQAVLLSMENNLENSKYVYLHLNLQCFYFFMSYHACLHVFLSWLFCPYTLRLI